MRRWLTFIAVFLFAAAVVQSVFFDEPRTSTVAADAEVKDERTEPVTDDREPVEQAQNEPTTQYHISSEPLFGGEEQRFVAHRGFSSSAPENSLPAFELAAKCGFWGIETDISESADGVFMCMHDDTMERTTDTGGAISDYTYSQLMEHNITDGTNIDYYKNLKIPTMIELLNVCIMNDLVPVIEIKHISNYDGFVQLINESGLKKRCIVTGAIADLQEIRARDAEIELMVIGYENVDYAKYIDLIAQIAPPRGILYQFTMVTQDIVKELHSSDIHCGVWCLDTADGARQYMDYGVDYVVTNEIPALNLMINTNE